MKTFDELKYKTVVLTKEEIDKTELDNEEDLKDLISVKLQVEKYEEVLSGWDESEKYYVLVVKS